MLTIRILIAYPSRRNAKSAVLTEELGRGARSGSDGAVCLIPAISAVSLAVAFSSNRNAFSLARAENFVKKALVWSATLWFIRLVVAIEVSIADEGTCDATSALTLELE